MSTGGLPRRRPDEVGVDPAGIHHFLNDVSGRGIELHSLMLLRHGAVYGEGWWAPYGAADAPLLYSLSKTFTSAAVGLAVDDGAFGYDDLLVDLFADVVEGPGPKASAIRVRDCLAMATGHTTDTLWTPRLACLPGREPWRVSLGQEPAGDPGRTFCYNQWATWTLAEVVRATTGRTVLELLGERVFGPLGVEGATWDADGAGRLLGFSGLHLPTEGVASFFQLLLDGGVRDGRRLLPAAWVEAHARAWTDTASETNADWAAGYGWQVWRNRRGGHRGDGAFGQFGIVLPEFDAVVVLTAQTERMQDVLDAVWTHLVPAFDRPVSADAAQVAARLASLALPPVRGERGGHVHLRFENRRNRWHVVDDEDGWVLRWMDAHGGDHRIPVGFQAWRHSELRWPSGTVPVAASGGWVMWGHWIAHLVTLNSPHGLLVRLRDDGSGRLEWLTTPLDTRGLMGLVGHPARGGQPGGTPPDA